MFDVKKKTILIAPPLVMLMVAIFIFNSYFRAGNSDSKGISVMPPTISEKKSFPTKNTEAKSSEESFSSTSSNDYHNSSIFQSWLKSHGYIESVGSVYDSYDNKTLKTLANNGDEYAVQKLGQIILREHGAKESANFYRDSATHGSTAALYGLSRVVLATDYYTALTPELKKLAAIEVMALNNTAAMRGDHFPNVYGNATNFSTFKNDGIIFDDVDRQKIKIRSEEIYNELQKKRNELGLGAFNNNVPNEVLNKFNEMESVFNGYKNK